MRASDLLVPWLLLCVACGQKLDHPDVAPACDPAVSDCTYTPPPATGSNGGGNEGGADSGGGAEVATFTGAVLAFDDDYFDRGAFLSGKAEVSATGEAGARITGSYDGKEFQLSRVLRSSTNWFLVTPELASGMLPTLSPIDTRKDVALTVGVANASIVDSIFVQTTGTERSTERAQIVLRFVDEQLRAVPGVTAKLTAEVTAYRAAGAWIGEATDASGMVFLGNVQAGTALSTVKVTLGGTVSGVVSVTIVAGATTVLTAIVSP
jgi:hypothetical protein